MKTFSELLSRYVTMVTKMEILGFLKYIFLEMNGKSVVNLTTKNGMSKLIIVQKLQ